MTFPGNANDVFEPAGTSESVASTPQFEGSNVCRAGALSSMLQGAALAVSQLVPEHRALGFSETVIDRGDRDWSLNRDLAGHDDPRIRPSEDLDETRITQWDALNRSANPRNAVGFLIAMLGSRLERESAAAAAALWRGLNLAQRLPRLLGRWPYRRRPFFEDLWPFDFSIFSEYERGSYDGDTAPDRPQRDWDSELWRERYFRGAMSIGRIERIGSDEDRYVTLFTIAALARERLEAAARSTDTISRAFALAALEPFGDADGGYAGKPPSNPPAATPGALVVSTMIHGTWGWKGDWWRPHGDFHRFILQNHRPNLYNRGAKFGWSGSYSEHQRAIAATDFVEWAYDVAPHGIQTTFGHSYGGDVAARAMVAGARIHELVLLSAPVTTAVDVAVESGAPIVDVRLRFDPVLAIAGTRQRISACSNVTEVLLDKWQLSHGATHEEDTWRDEDVARRGRL